MTAASCLTLLMLDLVLVTGPAARGDDDGTTIGADAPATEGWLTESAETVVQADGSYSTNIYNSPVGYQDSDGGFERIDDTLVPDPRSAYLVSNNADDYLAGIPVDGATTPVKFETDGNWVSLRMHGLTGTPSVQGSAATFTDVAKADSVTYEATALGLKESIVLSERPTESLPLEYVYSVDASTGLEPIQELQGEIAFVDPRGKVAITIPAGLMFDSSAGVGAVSHDVSFDLSRETDGWTLVVRPSMDWLMDPARVFPVTVDPSLTNEAPSQDCWIAEEESDASYCGSALRHLRVGRVQLGQKRRTLLDFDISEIPAEAEISGANAALYLDSSLSLNAQLADYAIFRTGKVFDNAATWNSAGVLGAWSAGGPNGAANGTKSLGGTSSGYRYFDVTDIVTGWSSGSDAHNGMVLKQVGETTNNVLQFFSNSPLNSTATRPFLNVTYTLPPEIEGTTVIELTETTSSEAGNVLSSSTKVLDQSRGFPGDDRPSLDPEVNAKIEQGSGGTPMSSGCKTITLENKKYSTTGIDHMYTYTTITKYCFNRATKTISNVQNDWDFYTDNDSVKWVSQVRKWQEFYPWTSGYSQSGYRHKRKGHFENCYFFGCTGDSYPVNEIKAHSDGTYTWWTDD